jgi:chromosome segregation ATPase
MRLIDADELIKKIYPMGMGDGMYVINAKAVKFAIDKTPTADVVPKSEVERLQAENEKLTINMNAYGLTAKRLAEENESLEIELENMRRNLGDAREGWNDAECEVDRLRNALDEYEETSGLKEAKAEVAREIFEEIKREFCGAYWYKGYTIERYIAELKKKYTEEETHGKTH